MRPLTDKPLHQRAYVHGARRFKSLPWLISSAIFPTRTHTLQSVYIISLPAPATASANLTARSLTLLSPTTTTATSAHFSREENPSMLATPSYTNRHHTYSTRPTSLATATRRRSREASPSSSTTSSRRPSLMAGVPPPYRGSSSGMISAMDPHQQDESSHPRYPHHPHSDDDHHHHQRRHPRPSLHSDEASASHERYYNGNTYTYQPASLAAGDVMTHSSQGPGSSRPLKRSRSSSKEQIVGDSVDGSKKTRPGAPEKRLSQAGAAKVVEKDGGTTTIFQCQGFEGCNMTFTRSEHLARHIRCVLPSEQRAITGN